MRPTTLTIRRRARGIALALSGEARIGSDDGIDETGLRLAEGSANL